MSFRLGVDVGGTFTDLLLINQESGEVVAKHKTPSTPEDSSIGVFEGIQGICEKAGIERSAIETVFHGTTVATNAVLEGKGAKVGLITTVGHRQVLHIDRSFVPGGLAGWIIWNKPEILAPLEATIEATERVSAKGEEVLPLDAEKLRADVEVLKQQQVAAVTICFLNAYVDGRHEREARAVVQEAMPGVPVSISSEVLPEMYEYERTLTTVANSYIRPNVSMYIKNLQAKLGDSSLRVLRSDGGLSSEAVATEFPVNLLMSGPAGGITGAVWVAKNAGFDNVLTLDMGGTSADVSLIQGAVPKSRRQTRVGDCEVRVSSLDVHTVGAGGGSIAHVPDITKALRVGPQSAGARPGPACYGKGGDEPTVTDANLVLGYLPATLLGGAMKMDLEASTKAVTKISDKLGMSVREAAAGIIDIVNENMVGALRLISVEQGYDPREFGLMAFGGAGALHANACARTMGSWPVIVPPSPGVLCAYGDATTRQRAETSRSYVRCLKDTTVDELLGVFAELARVAAEDSTLEYEVDVRYMGQGMTMPLRLGKGGLEKLKADGVAWLGGEFDAQHQKQFLFTIDKDREVVNFRAAAVAESAQVLPRKLAGGGKEPPAGALIGKQTVWMDHKEQQACFYDRAQLLAGNAIAGPAVITEMDSTTLVLSGCEGVVDGNGNIIISPVKEAAPASVASAGALSTVELELIENALQASRKEMDAVVFRAAMSPGIREQHDQFPLIADAAGDMVVGQFGSFVKGFLLQYTEPIDDGDVIFLSDPYSCDGAVSHCNDWLVLTPIMAGEKKDNLLGWAAMFGHMTDVGGKGQCSMPNDATTIYEEGIIIPPVKLYKKGELNADLLKLVLHQCRVPVYNQCDLMAIVASVKVAKERVLDIVSRFGESKYQQACAKMLERNHAAMKQLIATAVPDEKLYFEDYICDDAMGSGPFKLACTMFKENGTLVFDFEGTSPQSQGSVNFFLNKEMFKMFCGAYMIVVFDPSIIFNDGFYPLIDVRIPEGSLLRPRRPAALSCRTHALGRIFDILGGLLGQRAPQFMCAAGFSDSPHFMYCGQRTEKTSATASDETPDPFNLYSISFGGIPGRPFGDGPDGHSLWPSFTNVPCEFLECYFPLRVEAQYTIPDSGGAGLFRGGNGISQVFRLIESGEVAIHDDRWLTHPWGVNGGTPGQRSTKLLFKGLKDGQLEGNEYIPLPSKCDHFPVDAGDVLHFNTWGGGGWGNPFKREAALLKRDVLRGLVSKEAAKERFGVVLVDDAKEGVAVDEAATEALRKAALDAGKGEGLFDFGFRKEIKATPEDLQRLIASCEADTGLVAPALPVGGRATQVDATSRWASYASSYRKVLKRDDKAAVDPKDIDLETDKLPAGGGCTCLVM